MIIRNRTITCREAIARFAEETFDEPRTLDESSTMLISSFVDGAVARRFKLNGGNKVYTIQVLDDLSGWIIT